MQWPGMIRKGLSPVLAIGIIAASLFTAVSSKPNLTPSNDGTSASAQDVGIAQLWSAGAAKFGASPTLANLTETGGMTGGAWIETRSTPTVVGRSFGKLIVTREFGPSDEADASDIIEQPDEYLASVTIAFRPFTGEARDWLWARFAPDGTLLDTTGELPDAVYFAVLENLYCSGPIPQETAARS